MIVIENGAWHAAGPRSGGHLTADRLYWKTTRQVLDAWTPRARRDDHVLRFDLPGRRFHAGDPSQDRRDTRDSGLHQLHTSTAGVGQEGPRQPGGVYGAVLRREHR